MVASATAQAAPGFNGTRPKLLFLWNISPATGCLPLDSLPEIAVEPRSQVEKGGRCMKRVAMTKGGGNIFRDLGFSQERSAELIVKSSATF
jgi:hypothetical protein